MLLAAAQTGDLGLQALDLAIEVQDAALERLHQFLEGRGLLGHLLRHLQRHLLGQLRALTRQGLRLGLLGLGIACLGGLVHGRQAGAQLEDGLAGLFVIEQAGTHRPGRCEQAQGHDQGPQARAEQAPGAGLQGAH